MGNDKKKCILLKSAPPHNACHCFIDALEVSFSKLGYECDVLKPKIKSGEDLIPTINKLVEENNYNFAFSVNGYAPTVENKTKNIFDALGLNFFAYIVDSPIYLGDSMLYYAKYCKNAYVAFADHEHCELFRKISDKPCDFLPQGGFISQKYKEGGEFKKFSEREIDVLFSGTYRDFNEEYGKLKDKCSKTIMEFNNDVLDYMLENVTKSFTQSVSEILKKYDIILEAGEYLNFCFSLQSIDLIIRSLRRTEAIKVIADTGVKVVCYGNNWKKSILSEHKNVILMPDIHFYEYIDLMAESKITLNVLPNYSNGAHERIFSAMRNESLSVTDSTLYLNDILKNNENVLFYRHDKLTELGEIVNGALRDEESSMEIINSAKIVAENNHTWDDRAKIILNLLGEKIQ